MSNHKNRRPQTQKPRNLAFNEAMREKGRSSAASKHRNKAKYYRPEAKRQGWDD